MRRRIFLTSALGNIFDAYDANLYAVFASTLAPVFFPSSSLFTGLLYSLMAFAMAFLTRPLGAFLFGYLGDKYGRKWTLSLCMILMGVPTLIIGLLPPFSMIGLYAPCILILCRLTQGLCSGGELNGALIFSMEHAPSHKKGWIGGLIASTGVLGTLLAMGASAVLLHPSYAAHGWRFAFLIGALICLCGAVIRFKLLESPAFTQVSHAAHTRLPWQHVFTRFHPAFLVAFAKGAVNGTLSYLLIAFFPILLETFLNYAPHTARTVALIGLAGFMVGALASGYLFDKKPTAAPLVLTITTLFFCSPLFIAGVFALALPWVIVLTSLLGLLTGAVAGFGYPYLQRLFPPSLRYLGVSFGFCLGVSIFGGAGPFIMLSLSKSFSPLYTVSGYTSGTCLIFLSIYFYAKNKLGYFSS